jgi:glycosyltransferase involved in cell wall biosynthesis
MSVIIPAHDEELVIERCLRTLFSDAEPGELHIVVAANGCTDRTVELAGGWPVRVLDLPVASKHLALNEGDAAARRFPRFYVDADVQVTAGALREAAAVLQEGEAKAASPTMRLDLRGCTAPVRAYYRAWRQLPYCTEDLVGSGVYGVSEAGHRHLGGFPELIADDLWFRNRFRPVDRRAVDTGSFVQQPPRDLRSLLRVRTRQVVGILEYRDRFGHFGANAGAGPTGMARLGRRLLAPGVLPGAPVYVAVNLLARRAARRRWGAGELQWDSDRSARLGAPVAT